MNKFLSFTKQDIEELPPFEREGYIEMLKDYMEEYNEQIEKTQKGSLEGI